MHNLLLPFQDGALPTHLLIVRLLLPLCQLKGSDVIQVFLQDLKKGPTDHAAVQGLLDVLFSPGHLGCAGAVTSSDWCLAAASRREELANGLAKISCIGGSHTPETAVSPSDMENAIGDLMEQFPKRDVISLLQRCTDSALRDIRKSTFFFQKTHCTSFLWDHLSEVTGLVGCSHLSSLEVMLLVSM